MRSAAHGLDVIDVGRRQRQLGPGGVVATAVARAIEQLAQLVEIELLRVEPVAVGRADAQPQQRRRARRAIERRRATVARCPARRRTRAGPCPPDRRSRSRIRAAAPPPDGIVPRRYRPGEGSLWQRRDQRRCQGREYETQQAFVGDQSHTALPCPLFAQPRSPVPVGRRQSRTSARRSRRRSSGVVLAVLDIYRQRNRRCWNRPRPRRQARRPPRRSARRPECSCRRSAHRRPRRPPHRRPHRPPPNADRRAAGAASGCCCIPPAAPG